VPDEPGAIEQATRAALARQDIRAILLTGGTGVAPRDVTPETVEPLLERTVPGFGELFRMLSYEDIGSAALLSRALAGLAAGKVVFVMPGSRGAIRLALEKLILPEIGHLAAEAVKTR
jgi:molybdenum cofactor biosynthesis protein B